MENQDRYLPWKVKEQWFILDTQTGRKHSPFPCASEEIAKEACNQLNATEPLQYTFTREEVLKIAKEAYKAGHQECDKHWCSAEGGKEESYEDFYDDYYSFPELYINPQVGDKIPQIDNWIKENLK